MRTFTAIFAISLAATPLLAEENELREGLDLLSQGTQLLLRGLMAEMEPTLEDLEGALREMDGMLDNLSGYHAPEILPNGDILIRRKTPGSAKETPEIDL